jgi:hypothetical protein
MEQLPKASAPDAIRLVVPRAINLLYNLRNKRLGGHTVSEVDPSEMMPCFRSDSQIGSLQSFTASAVRRTSTKHVRR